MKAFYFCFYYILHTFIPHHTKIHFCFYTSETSPIKAQKMGDNAGNPLFIFFVGKKKSKYIILDKSLHTFTNIYLCLYMFIQYLCENGKCVNVAFAFVTQSQRVVKVIVMANQAELYCKKRLSLSQQPREIGGHRRSYNAQSARKQNIVLKIILYVGVK